MILSRSMLLAIAISAAASLVLALGIHAYLGTVVPDVPKTVGEAVKRRAGIRLIELLKAGADPKLLIEVTVNEIAEGRPIAVNPLAYAVANNDTDYVVILALIGIPWTEDEKREAYCMSLLLKSSNTEFYRTFLAKALSGGPLDGQQCRKLLEHLGTP